MCRYGQFLWRLLQLFLHVITWLTNRSSLKNVLECHPARSETTEVNNYFLQISPWLIWASNRSKSCRRSCGGIWTLRIDSFRAFSNKLRLLKMGLTWEVRIYRKTQDPAASIATIAAAIEEDHPFTGGFLLSFTGLSIKTIHRIWLKTQA